MTEEQLILICSHNTSLRACAIEANTDVNTFKRWCIKANIEYPKKYTMTEEHKERLRQSNINKKHNFKPETLQKLSKLKKGIKISEEHRLAISKGHIKYYEKEENRQKQSEILKQRNYHHSDETKQKISTSNTGKIYSEDSKIKISNSLKEYYANPENKAKQVALTHTDEIKERIIKTCLERYGVPYPCMTEQARNAAQTKSKINLLWQKELNISDDNMEFPINQYSYDLKKNNILIEINPTYSHNSSIVPWFGNKKGHILNTLYHQQKTKTAIEAGYSCIHVWDWDDPQKIKMLLQDKTSIYARNLIIKDVPKQDTDTFLNTYHLQNTCKNQSIRLGLYTKDTNELIQIMTFGKPRYNKNYEYELLRLCTKAEYTVIGGSDKLFKHFIKTYNPNSIISYCDNSKFKGTVYLKLGFKLKSYGKPSCHWYNIKTKDHITDNLLRQQGADRLLGTNFGKGTSNKDIMLQFGFLEVYDCGQSIYIWNKE